MEQHWVVGGLAIASGLVSIAGGVFNFETFFKLFWVGRMFDARWGRTAARAIYVFLGVFLILLGAAVSAGVRVDWEQGGPKLHIPNRTSALATR